MQTMDRLTRDESEAMLAGVCAGLADYFGVDVHWLRIGLVIATIFFAPVLVLAYAAAAIVMPAGGAPLAAASREGLDDEALHRATLARDDAELERAMAEVGFATSFAPLLESAGDVARSVSRAAGDAAGAAVTAGRAAYASAGMHAAPAAAVRPARSADAAGMATVAMAAEGGAASAPQPAPRPAPQPAPRPEGTPPESGSPGGGWTGDKRPEPLISDEERLEAEARRRVDAQASQARTVIEKSEAREPLTRRERRRLERAERQARQGAETGTASAPRARRPMLRRFFGVGLMILAILQLTGQISLGGILGGLWAPLLVLLGIALIVRQRRRAGQR